VTPVPAAAKPRSERPAMVDYGVPNDPAGTLPWAWAAERLTSCRNFWVITVNGSGAMARPHAMPVWGVWLEIEQRFWFSCAPSAAKHRNLLANPHVTIAVSDTVEVVTVEGRAAHVPRFPDQHQSDQHQSDQPRSDQPLSRERALAVSTYGAKYAEADQRVELEEFMSSHALWQVTPTRAYAIIEREDEFASKATRWVWEPRDTV
jgi:hypothetical protein